MKSSTLPLGLNRPQLTDEVVKAAISRVPRQAFVPAESKREANSDRALSIGCGQTISQPFIVALMTQEAKLHPTARVLEIGTGSGYQAAVLSELGAEVYSIEIIPELSASAQKTLSELGYDKVKLKCGDGAQGWPEFAPFDAILITACCPAVPSELLRQLKDRGRLIAPVEDADGDGETLIVITREEDRYLERRLSSVRFVPMTGSVREAS